MKALYKSLLVLSAAAPLLTGCIEETFPTSGVTQDQLEGSSKAVDATIWAMPAWMNHFATVSDDQAYDWGYGSIMHIRDVLTEDMAISSSSYNWFSTWSGVNRSMGPDYMATQFIYTFFTKQVLACNKAIATINPDTATPDQVAGLGSAYAFRASIYLDMAQMYEFLPNADISPINGNGVDVTGLTVPIVTEKTTELEARNNPRATHEQMYEFILSDLEQAEYYLTGAGRISKILPDISVAYGIKARLYMWDAQNDKKMEQYAKAAEYARKAIVASGATPMTEDEWLNTSTGFNTLDVSSWMWGLQLMKEDRVVTTGILNWTSWLSNEAQYGYASAGPFVQIGASLYERMNDRDFRKLAFVAPAGSPLSGKESYCDPAFAADKFEGYFSLKFRPNLGVTTNHLVGSAAAIPLMRVEEMYFIEAEAKAHTAPAEGLQLLTDFMKTYRYGTYKTLATSAEDVVEEIVFQKRVEFFGEGLTFFDIKRLNYSVTRAYDGTNFATNERYNTTGRPGWMNICLVQSEGTNNKAVLKANNPDPYGHFTPVRM